MFEDECIVITGNDTVGVKRHCRHNAVFYCIKKKSKLHLRSDVLFAIADA